MRRPEPAPGECRHCFREHAAEEMCWPAVAEVRLYGNDLSTDRLESFILDITHPRQNTRAGAHGFAVNEAKAVTARLRQALADGTLTPEDLTVSLPNNELMSK